MDIEQLLFSPLDRTYCTWFYVWMVLAFVSTALSCIFVAMYSNRFAGREGGMALSAIIHGFFSYINFRLLYTMCMH